MNRIRLETSIDFGVLLRADVMLFGPNQPEKSNMNPTNYNWCKVPSMALYCVIIMLIKLNLYCEKSGIVNKMTRHTILPLFRRFESVFSFLVQPWCEEEIKLWLGASNFAASESIVNEDHLRPYPLETMKWRRDAHKRFTRLYKKNKFYGYAAHLFNNVKIISRTSCMMRNAQNGGANNGNNVNNVNNNNQQRQRRNNNRGGRGNNAGNLLVAGLVQGLQQLQGQVDGQRAAAAQNNQPRPDNRPANNARDIRRLRTRLNFSHDPKLTSFDRVAVKDTFYYLALFLYVVYCFLIPLNVILFCCGFRVVEVLNKLMNFENSETYTPDKYSFSYRRDTIWDPFDVRDDVHRIEDPIHAPKLGRVTGKIVTELSSRQLQRAENFGGFVTSGFGWENIRLAKVKKKTFTIDLELFSQLTGPSILSGLSYDAMVDSADRFVKRSTTINYDRYGIMLTGENIIDNTVHVACCYYRKTLNDRISNVRTDFHLPSPHRREHLCSPIAREKFRAYLNTKNLKTHYILERQIESNSLSRNVLKWFLLAFTLMGTLYLMSTLGTQFPSTMEFGTGWGKLCLEHILDFIESSKLLFQIGSRQIWSH